MSRYDGTFKLFYGPKTTIDVEFRVRNHVDLLVALTFSRFQQVKTGTFGRLQAVLLRKFKYRDTRADMGLWLYRIEAANPNSLVLIDHQFEEFPQAFEKIPEMMEEIPNIFD